MYYKGQCGSCINFEDANSNSSYDDTQPSYVKGYCSWYRSYYYPDESCTDHYKMRSSSSDCYITTILCNRLGLNDHSDELETLRSFRNNVLQKDSKYQDILYEYDLVGPRISKELEKEDISVIQRLYQSFLQPVVRFLKEKNYEQAIERYKKMTKSLEEYYAISYDPTVPKNYSYENGGHGKIKIIRAK